MIKYKNSEKLTAINNHTQSLRTKDIHFLHKLDPGIQQNMLRYIIYIYIYIYSIYIYIYIYIYVLLLLQRENKILLNM